MAVFRRLVVALAGVALCGVAEAKYSPAVEKRRAEVRPFVDLTTDPARYSVVCRSESYDAHPSSVMLADGKTVFCFWDLQHGGPMGPAAVSRDAGRTWSRIDASVPKAFTNCYDAPVAFRFVDPKTGKSRLRVFGAMYGDRGPTNQVLKVAMPSILSEDDGKSWTYLPPMGEDFTCFISFFGMVQLKDGSYLGGFHRGACANGWGSPLQVMLSRSTDGGLTWEKPWCAAKKKGYELCEPCLFYSPDKSELCMLIREDGGQGLSQMCFSKDEGRTWTDPVDAPADLYGDRHVALQLPDGRYLIVFRNLEPKQPHVFGWVGPYSGIRDGSGNGGYRVKLVYNDCSPWDCGYQGVHLAADGTIVLTTYTCLRGKPNAHTPDIVSMRFRIEDADKLRGQAPDPDPWVGKYHLFGKYAYDRPFCRYNSNLDKAFAFLKRPDLKTLPVGTYELAEKKGDCFAMVQEVDLKPYNAAKESVEAHREYIDIQAPIDGEETFGVADVGPDFPDFPLNAGKDYGLVDAPTGCRTIGPGEFALFFPGRGGHAPCKSLTGPRHLKKVCIKIRRDKKGCSLLAARYVDAVCAQTRTNGVAAWCAALRADGSWADVDYTSRVRATWPTAAHLTRLNALAAASRITGDDALRGAAHKALGFWLRKRFDNPNWWWNVIGIPMYLGDAVLMLDGELTAAERREAIAIMNVAEPDFAKTGQNFAWMAENRLRRGLLARDDKTVRTALDDILSEVRMSEQEGIRPDWCFHQHGQQPQFGNYGLSFLCDQARLSALLAGTDYPYPADKLTLVRKLASEGYAWILWKGRMDVSAMGRQLDVDYQRKKAAAVEHAFANLEKSGWRSPEARTGFRYFDRSAYAVFRTDQWMASVRASTPKIIGTETWVNEDNVKGMCMADGALLTYVTGAEYDGVLPLWDDWRMIPGVTGYLGKPVNRNDSRNQKDDIVASGDRNQGAFEFTFAREGLTAHKKWTFDRDGVTCEGSDISATDGAYTVATCVEHALAAPDAGIVYQRASESRFRNGSIVYTVYAPPEAISFAVAERQGNYNAFMQAHASKPVSGKVFTLRILHGKCPKNTAYRYRIDVVR